MFLRSLGGGGALRLLGILELSVFAKEINDTKDAAAEESKGRRPLNKHQNAQA